MASGIIYDQMEANPFEKQEELHLLDLLIALSTRRKFILASTLGVATLTAIVVLLLPSKYTAETLVLPPPQNSSVGSALLGQLGAGSAIASVAGSSFGIKNPGDMYVSLFHTRTVEDSLIRRFGLMNRYHSKRMSDARLAFENHSDVTLGTKDGLIKITVTDRDPKMAADMANAYVDEFRKLSANLAITEASQRRLFFQQQLLEANENLATAEEAMKKTQQTTGVLQVDAQARSLIESAAVLRAQIAAKEVEIQSLRTSATEDNPQMVVAEQQLSALKFELARLAGSDANASSDIIVPKGNIPQAGMEYIRKLREVKYYETVFELIAKQFEVAKLDEAKQGSVVQVADIAVPPDKRSSPKRTISVVVAGLLSFVLACSWCVFAKVVEHLEKNPNERRRMEALRATFSKN